MFKFYIFNGFKILANGTSTQSNCLFRANHLNSRSLSLKLASTTSKFLSLSVNLINVCGIWLASSSSDSSSGFRHRIESRSKISSSGQHFAIFGCSVFVSPIKRQVAEKTTNSNRYFFVILLFSGSIFFPPPVCCRKKFSRLRFFYFERCLFFFSHGSFIKSLDVVLRVRPKFSLKMLCWSFYWYQVSYWCHTIALPVLRTICKATKFLLRWFWWLFVWWASKKCVCSVRSYCKELQVDV